MPFPIIKLGYLVVKQISKPLANIIKSKAKTTPFLRNKILLPPAQLYHKLDTTIKMKLLGLGKVSSVKPLNEDIAVDLAADMLGEAVIFTIAAGLLLAEYKRQTWKDLNKEDLQNLRLQTLENQLRKVTSSLEEQSIWIENVAKQLKIPAPVITQIQPQVVSPEKEVPATQKTDSEASQLPNQITNPNSKTVLQVIK